MGSKGYGRKASALEFMGRYADAVEVYEEGLKIDPTNEQYKDAMANAIKSVNRSERAMPSMFGAPDVFAKLEKGPRTKDFAKDPSFVSTIKLLQANPNAIMQHLSDPRIMSALSVIMGVDVSGGDAPPPPSSGPRTQAWSEDSTPKPAASKKEKTPPKPAKRNPWKCPCRPMRRRPSPSRTRATPPTKPRSSTKRWSCTAKRFLRTVRT